MMNDNTVRDSKKVPESNNLHDLLNDLVAQVFNSMQDLQQRINKICVAYPWKANEYNQEIALLNKECQEKYGRTSVFTNLLGSEETRFAIGEAILTAATKPQFDSKQFVAALYMGAEYAVSLIETYPEDLYNALTDRGAQETLFDDEKDVPPKFKGYAKEPAEVRRLMILNARSLLENARDFFTLSEKQYEQSEEKTNIITKRPTQLIYPLAKIFNAAFDGYLSETPIEISLENYKAKKKITAIATLKREEIEKQLNNLNGFNPTPYDKAVYVAIVTEYENGNNIITPDMIYKTIHSDDSAYLAPNSPQREKIIDSIKRFLGYVLDYDTADIEKKSGKKIYNTRLIPRRYIGALIAGEYAEFEKITLNGQEIQGFFRIFRRPILHEISSDIRQVTSIPAETAALPSKSNTETAAIIKLEILERIRIMQNSKNNKKKISNKIKLDSLYGLAEIPEGSTAALRKKRASVRDIAKETLENCKKQKEIKSYEEEKGARGAIVAFKITL